VRIRQLGDMENKLIDQKSKLIDRKSTLHDRLGHVEQMWTKEQISSEHYNEERKIVGAQMGAVEAERRTVEAQLGTVEAQIAEAQKMIQEWRAELKEFTKKSEAAPQAREAELTQCLPGVAYAKALVEAKEMKAGDSTMSPFLPIVVLTVCTRFIPGFKKFARQEADLMAKKGVGGILIFGRKCFVQVVGHLFELRENYIGGLGCQYCIISGQSGVGKSLACSQVYMREAFKRREKLAFYSVGEKRIYLFWAKDTKYTCQQAKVTSEFFDTSRMWKSFDDNLAHLIIDPAQGKGPGFFDKEVEAFVVYLTSPNMECKDFLREIRDLHHKRFFVPTLDIDEIKVVAAQLKEDPKLFLERYARTGGQIRDFIHKDRYKAFERAQDNAWSGVGKTEVISLDDRLEASSRLCAVQPFLTDEGILYSENYVIMPQSEWVQRNVLEAIALSSQQQITGLKGEKWFFSEILNGCKLQARRLPKQLAKQKSDDDDWCTKTWEFPRHGSVKTWSDRTQAAKDECRDHIKNTAENKTSELIVCPPDYPAIDGATNCRTLYQVTIRSNKSIDDAYVKEFMHFGATEAKKARVVFLVPSSMSSHFRISFKTGCKKVALELAEFWVVGINVPDVIRKAQRERAKKV